MNRMNPLVVAILALAPFACGGSSSSGNGTADAPGAPKCGDGICAITEVNACPADCGTHTSMGSSTTGNPCNLDGVCETQNGENAINCPQDCMMGSGSAVLGSGSSATGIDCSDPMVVSDCTMCLETFGSDCGMTGITNCLSCVF